MGISKAIKMLLVENSMKQNDLAEAFEMTKQTMSNKVVAERWSGKDLLKVAALTGCELAFILPDGRKIVIENE